MANRYITFGYEIIDGAINIVEREAEVVRNVYMLYIQGLSLIEISKRLNMITVSYASDDRDWNKNMVKRMLENPKYTGENGYPQIVTKDIANLALEYKAKRYVPATDEAKIRNDVYRKKLECGLCGSSMKKITAGSGELKKVYWQCENEDCELHRKTLNEKILNELISETLNEIAENLSLIEVTLVKDYERSTSIAEVYNKVIEKIENSESEIEAVIERIMNLASEKFKLCKAGDNTEITKGIKAVMSVYPQKDIPDGKVMEKVIKKIKIYPNKTINIVLINNKTFEKRKLKKSEMRC